MTLLTDLVTLKSYLALTGIEYDTLLTRLIGAASAFIETWLGQTIAVTNYNEVHNGNGGNKLYLSRYPVLSVGSVTIDNLPVPVSTKVKMNGYSFNGHLIYLRGFTFSHGVLNVAVSYSAGWSVNAPTDVPADLAQACIELIALKFRRMGSENLSAQGMAGETTTYVVTDMPKFVLTVLRQYKNVIPA